MKASDALEMARKELKGRAPKPYHEGLWLLGKALGASSSKICLKAGRALSLGQKNLFLDMLQKRRAGWPLDYLLGESFFCGRRFFVQPGVFIPRPETEIIVEEALRLRSSGRLAWRRGADFGAGAGPISLSLLREAPDSQFAAIDLSRKALEALRKNSAFLRGPPDRQKRLHALQKDVSLTEKKELSFLLGGAPDIITANPPYVAAGDKALDPSVCLYEPPLAFFSDRDGMGHIVSWLDKAMDILSPGGACIFEFGCSQSGRVQELLTSRRRFISSSKILKDRAGRDRAALCFKRL